MDKIKMTILFVIAIFIALTTKAQEKPSWEKWSILTTTENLPSTEGHLLTIPDMGLFYSDNGMLHALDSVKCQSLKKLRFKDNFSFDQLIVNDGTFLVKSQQFVLQVDADQTKMVTELDTDCFDIYSGHDGKYNLVIQEDSATWAWYCCDIKEKKMECVVRMNEPITTIVDGDSAKFCLVGNRIYLVTGKEFILMTEAPEPVMDMIFTQSGLLLCTQHTLYCIGADLQTDIIANGQFHSLYYDNGTLYIVLQNGDILKGL